MILYDDSKTREIWQHASFYLSQSQHVSHLSFANCIETAEEEYYRDNLKSSQKHFTAMAQAVYDRIKEDFSWSYEWQSYDPYSMDQRVRLIQHVWAEKKGTCLELVLVYIGCLEGFHFLPLYVHLRHKEGAVCHAVAGYWMIPTREVLEETDVLDGTALINHIEKREISLVDCTGFVNGKHKSADGSTSIVGKLSFEDAQKFAHGYLAHKDWEIDFALNVRKAREMHRQNPVN